MPFAAWPRLYDRLRRVDPALLVGCGATLVFVASVASASFEFGSLEGDWRFRYYRRTPWSALLPFALAAGLALPLLAWSLRGIERRAAPWIAMWLLAGAAVTFALRLSYPFNLDQIVRSNLANSYYSTSLSPGLRPLLEDFGSVAPGLRLHARGNMPGKTALYTLLGLFTRSPQALGTLVVLLSGLSGLLVYAIARELGADRRAALLGLVLSLLLPGKVAFVPLLNVIAPVFVLTGFLLLLRFLRRREAWATLLLGTVVYAAAFFDPFPLTMAPLFALFVLVALAQGRLDAGGLTRLLGLSAVAFAASHAVVRGALGFDLFAALAYVFEYQRRFVGGSQRPYDVWVVENLIEFGVSLGVCTTVLWLAELGRVLLPAGSAAAPLHERAAQPMALLSLGCLAVVLLVDLSGTVRGEVARLWIYVACFVQIPVAVRCARVPGISGILVLLTCTLLQTAVSVGMVAFVVP